MTGSRLEGVDTLDAPTRAREPLVDARAVAELFAAVQRASARPLPVLALTATEAPATLGVSVDFFKEHISGDLRWVRRGRKKLVSVRELERWLDSNAARVFEKAAS